MANTTNFNWETPDDTDLVKDGAAAIRTLGSAIDTSLVDLKGGTTGQVLSKATNTDMDFTWVTSDDTNAIQNAIVDAKGDIVAASAADTPARLAVGTDNQRLVAASGEATGLKYVSDTQNTVVDAEGDLLVGDSADTLQRLAIGTTGQVLTVDTAIDGKIKWATATGGSSGPAFRVYRNTTTQSLTQDVFTKVQFNAESFDTDNCFDSTTNYRFTPDKAGYYLFQVNILFDNVATTDRNIISFYFNGSNNARIYDGVGGISGPANNGSLLKYFNGTTDYMEVYVLTKAASAAVFNGSEFSFFSGIWIRS